MRVIAGTARRLLLVTPPGRDTRPTTDRIKETLFNILQPQLAGCRFLDLFAGSGGIGIEALSRGAEYACFADRSKEAIACIRRNLEHTGLSGRASVYSMDAAAAVRQMRAERRRFDFVFLDPPYGKGLELSALTGIREAGLLEENGTVIVETPAGIDLAPYEAAGYRISSVKEYKTNRHLFLKLAGDAV